VGGGWWEKIDPLFDAKWSYTTEMKKLQEKTVEYCNGTIEKGYPLKKVGESNLHLPYLTNLEPRNTRKSRKAFRAFCGSKSITKSAIYSP